MVMMFVGGVVLLFDGLLVLFLPKEIFGAGVFVPTRTLIAVKLLISHHAFCLVLGVTENGQFQNILTIFVL